MKLRTKRLLTGAVGALILLPATMAVAQDTRIINPALPMAAPLLWAQSPQASVRYIQQTTGTYRIIPPAAAPQAEAQPPSTLVPFNPLVPYGPGNGYSGSINATPFNPLVPYGPGNGYTPSNNRHERQHERRRYYNPGYEYNGGNYSYNYSAEFGGIVLNQPPGYLPSTIVGESGYYFNGYTASDVAGSCPTVYGSYIGMPGYFYAPGSIVFSGNSITYENGTWYPYSYDPYNVSTAQSYHVAEDSKTATVISQSLQHAINVIGNAWKMHDMTAFSTVMPISAPIGIARNGQYGYSITPKDYELMTRDAMQRLKTYNFRFTGVRMNSPDSATAFGVQDYQAPTGDKSRMYVAYTLQKSDEPSGKYTVTQFDTSLSPLPGSTAQAGSVNYHN